MDLITVESIIEAPIDMVWDFWTKPEHVMHWNFASNDWHCPKANSDFNVGGEFHYIMAAKDGSVEFDFCGTFTKIIDKTFIEIFLEDGRELNIQFESEGSSTKIIETFEPEEVNSMELQKQGWQAILDNFKSYTESK
ncbi:MAG: SRPBCC domain-containing protein [Sediminibacterium sp.]